MLVLAYSKLTTNSQKAPRTSAPLDNTEKPRQILHKAKEIKTFSAWHIHSHSSLPQLYSLASNISLERKHLSHSNCQPVYFTPVPLQRKEPAGTNFIQKYVLWVVCLISERL